MNKDFVVTIFNISVSPEASSSIVCLQYFILLLHCSYLRQCLIQARVRRLPCSLIGDKINNSNFTGFLQDVFCEYFFDRGTSIFITYVFREVQLLKGITQCTLICSNTLKLQNYILPGYLCPGEYCIKEKNKIFQNILFYFLYTLCSALFLCIIVCKTDVRGNFTKCLRIILATSADCCGNIALLEMQLLPLTSGENKMKAVSE